MNNTAIIGFVPLIDAAPLIVAYEKGFAQDAGIKFRLVRQPSWASLRDHLNLGHLDCAHTLAPLPIATALGIGQVRAPLIVPMALSRGGSAITVSAKLAEQMRAVSDGPMRGAAASAAALAKVVAQREEPLTLGMVYPYSGHNFEIRYWLASAGVHPDRDVRLVAIPPPLMVESLRAGQVDGFCVGEPWNSVAVHQGFGEIVATKAEIFPHGIEKVLAMPASAEDDPQRLHAIVSCLHRAAQWCDAPENRSELAQMLCARDYLNLPAAMLEQALAGSMPGVRSKTEDFIYFARDGGGRPGTEEALFLFAQMCRWGQLPDTTDYATAVQAVFRPDLFDAIVGEPALPSMIAACDGTRFDGVDVPAYLQRFALSTPFGVSPDSSA